MISSSNAVLMILMRNRVREEELARVTGQVQVSEAASWSPWSLGESWLQNVGSTSWLSWEKQDSHTWDRPLGGWPGRRAEDARPGAPGDRTRVPGCTAASAEMAQRGHDAGSAPVGIRFQSDR